MDCKQARETMQGLYDGLGYAPMECVPIATRKGGAFDKGALHFRCTLTKGDRSHTVEYSVGSDIPILWAKENASEVLPKIRGYSRKDFDNLSPYKSPTLHEEGMIQEIRRLYLPSALDVFVALLVDTEGFEPGMTFREWWDDCGADLGQDAPDASESFQAIERTARFLARTVPSKTLDEMRALAVEI